MTTPENPEVTPETPAITATPATPAPEAETPQPPASKPTKKKSSCGMFFLIAALFILIVLAAVAGGGWYYLKHHVVVIANRTFTLMKSDEIAATQPADQNAAQPTAQPSDQSAVQPAPAPATDQSQQTAPPPPTPVVTGKKPYAGSKKSAAQPVPAPSATANNHTAAAAPKVDRPAAQPSIPSVNFDPFKLDRETNARLKIDPSKFPAGLTFVVYMDGQLLYTGNTSKRADFDKFVIPPGVHQMQLTVSSGNVTLTSNIVSAEFVVQKHLTFKVEFRAPGSAPESNPPTLDPNTQLIAKLKTDFFHF
jgi:hypothetical protein